MPSWGMVLTLVLWGYVLDRVGERIVLTMGSALTAVATCAAASASSLVWTGVYLFLGGMAAASCNAAGGRLVSAWFPTRQRGLAMGIRQTAQPLGIALGALVIPKLSQRGIHPGLMFVATDLHDGGGGQRDLDRRSAAESPQRGNRAGTGQSVSRDRPRYGESTRWPVF